MCQKAHTHLISYCTRTCCLKKWKTKLRSKWINSVLRRNQNDFRLIPGFLIKEVLRLRRGDGRRGDQGRTGGISNRGSSRAPLYVSVPVVGFKRCAFPQRGVKVFVFPPWLRDKDRGEDGTAIRCCPYFYGISGCVLWWLCWNCWSHSACTTVYWKLSK